MACTAKVVIVGQDVPLLRPRPSCPPSYPHFLQYTFTLVLFTQKTLIDFCFARSHRPRGRLGEIQRLVTRVLVAPETGLRAMKKFRLDM